MTGKRTVMLGVLAVVALTGCATGGAFYARDPNYATDAGGMGSPSFESSRAAICAEGGGTYDSVAGACDDNAP